MIEIGVILVKAAEYKFHLLSKSFYLHAELKEEVERDEIFLLFNSFFEKAKRFVQDIQLL